MEGVFFVDVFVGVCIEEVVLVLYECGGKLVGVDVVVV